MRSSGRERGFASGERKNAAPAGEHGNVLFGAHSVCHRRSDHAALSVGGPKFLAGVCAVGFKVALRCALEDKVSGGREESAVDRTLTIDAPDFSLLNGIPRREMAFNGAEDGFLDFRLLRHAASDEVNADVIADCFLLEMFVRFVKEPCLLNGQIDESCVRAEGHGMPAVASRGTGSNRSALPSFVTGLRIFDGTAGFQINTGSPGDGGVGFRGNEFAGGAIENVEKTILGRVKQNFARRLVDGEVGKDDGFGRIEIPGVAGSFLIMPDVFTGVGFQSDDGRQEKIVTALGAAGMPVPRSAVADAEVDEIKVGVVGDGVPNGAAAGQLARRACPSFGGLFEDRRFVGLRRITGDGVEAPDHFSGGSIVSRDIAAHAILSAAVADQHFAFHDSRSSGDGVREVRIDG